MGIATQDLLSLQLENQTQHSVSSRMLRSKVDSEVAGGDVDTVVNFDVLSDGGAEWGSGAEHVAVHVVVV